MKLLRTQESTKTSIPSGMKKICNFSIFEFCINKKGLEQNVILSSDSFNISNKDFHWMTMIEIENDQDVLDKNRDVLSVVESFGYN